MRFFTEPDGIRSPGVFELYWKSWGLGFEVDYTGADFEDNWPWMLHVHFLLLSLYLHIPFILYAPPSKREKYMRERQTWGFRTFEWGIHFHWNERFARWDYPFFTRVFQRHEVRRADGSWAAYVGTWEQDKAPDGRELMTFPYTYKLRSGQIQERTATVYVDRMAHRRKWFTWTRLSEVVRTGISVEFSDEVGERSGSWKGGTIGCGWEMLPGETAEQTLRRMERERVFN